MTTRDEKKTAHLQRMMDRYTGQFRAAVNEEASTVARGIHDAIDLVLERDRAAGQAGSGIRCHRGCSHCCHEPVEIWPHEAALLLEGARANDVDLDRARLERQSRHTIDTWRQQPAADTGCGFLGEDGACRVYAFRPNACRKLLVVTEPAFCDADKHSPDEVGRWFSWEAEVMESAALETFGAALMPGALLAAGLK
jgi:Fe-S-cluster containining protein